MFWTILFIIVAVVVGYYFGKEAQKDVVRKNDPDNQGTLTDNQSTMLAFTKKDRYEYGRAMALGTNKEIKEAKQKLENMITSVHESAYRAGRNL